MLEDALLLRDADAVAGLFEDGSLLIGSEIGEQVRGRAEILRAAAMLWQNGGSYLADPRRVFQAGDVALLIGDQLLSVARRGQDGSWRFAISILRCG